MQKYIMQFPEIRALKQIYWQFFVTLTFADPIPPSKVQHIATFSWLRDLAAAGHVHFKRLLWVRRYEVGQPGERGHFHFCIAGLPSRSTQTFTRQMETLWRQRTGGFADIRRYEPTRGGLGYILKTPQTMAWATDQDEQYPTLSKSLFATLRRCRM